MRDRKSKEDEETQPYYFIRYPYFPIGLELG
jgi:hypothetical protein